MLLLPVVVALIQPETPAKTEPAANPPATAVDLAARPAVPFPHPIITEVLYAVPSGAGGDANKDGKREGSGNEFIELGNPHEKAIQRCGYTLTDSQEAGKGQMKFTFPAMELPPGGVVVVFNGMNSTWSGPVGDSKAPPPPPGKNEGFGGAWVFSMKNVNSKIALGNQGDQVLLSAPDNTPVQRVYWSEEGPVKEEAAPAAPAPAEAVKPGTTPPAPPAKTVKAKAKPLVEDFAPLVQKTSVHRDSVFATGRFVSHLDSEHAAYSPGVYVVVRAPGKPEEAEKKP